MKPSNFFDVSFFSALDKTLTLSDTPCAIHKKVLLVFEKYIKRLGQFDSPPRFSLWKSYKNFGGIRKCFNQFFLITTLNVLIISVKERHFKS